LPAIGTVCLTFCIFTKNIQLLNTALFIAKRYLLARKSHNLINIISGISVVGIGVGAFALIVVLSVFNGFERIISGLYDTVSPDLLIEAKTGKTFMLGDFPLSEVEQLSGVAAISEVVEEDALFRYRDQQHLGRVKGVSNVYQQMSQFDSLITRGSFLLSENGFEFAVIGAGVSYFLGANISDPSAMLVIYLPKRGRASSFSLEHSFNNKPIQLSGVYATQHEYDSRYVFVPVNWARELLEYTDEVTSIEIFTDKRANISSLQRQLQQIAGEEYLVKDRFQQQETLYRIMRSEKWAIFLILMFILIMATFNIIGSLTMLVIDKRKDIGVLRSLGAGQTLLDRLFLTEGILISISGGIAGLLVGVAVVLLQQYFGLLKLGGADGAFIVDAYPVHLKIVDVLVVFATVVVIGFLSSAYTVRQTVRKFQTLALKHD
jgi:lipoprotein-releasing system permease protein